jgi:hypothetical protein
MNEEKLTQILKDIGQTDVPANVTYIAEQTAQRFASALSILQAQQPQRARFITGFRPIAVAAAVLFVFAVGLSVGRWSKPSQLAPPSLNVAVYASPIPAQVAARQSEDSFWRQKALAAMQPRPYAQTGFDKTSLLFGRKQYLQGGTL